MDARQRQEEAEGKIVIWPRPPNDNEQLNEILVLLNRVWGEVYQSQNGLKNIQITLGKIMSAQTDVDAAVTAVGGLVTDVAEVVADLKVAVANIQAEIASFGTPVDTTALNAAVAGFTEAETSLAEAQAAVDALETPAPAPVPPVGP